MNEGKEPLFTPNDVEELARDIGRPLNPDLKKRIMDKVHEQRKERSLNREREVEDGRDKSRLRRIE